MGRFSIACAPVQSLRKARPCGTGCRALRWLQEGSALRKRSQTIPSGSREYFARQKSVRVHRKAEPFPMFTFYRGTCEKNNPIIRYPDIGFSDILNTSFQTFQHCNCTCRGMMPHPSSVSLVLILAMQAGYSFPAPGHFMSEMFCGAGQGETHLCSPCPQGALR